MSGLKVSSLDSLVYELLDALILSIISSSVLGASRVIRSESGTTPPNKSRTPEDRSSSADVASLSMGHIPRTGVSNHLP